MHKFIFYNNRIVSAKNTFLPAASSAAFYGKSIFTTVAVYNSKPFQLEKHRQRLNENAEKVGVNLSDFSESFIEKSLTEIIEKNKLDKARVRLTFFDESSSNVWQTDSKQKTGFLITSADFRAEMSEPRLTVSGFRVNSSSPLAGVKSGNYLENILVSEDAKARGFDEAIRLNERGEIVSATMANIFWTKRGEIFTPSLQTGCLSGTTRSFVLENFAVKETEADLVELENADEIFLTSAGVEISAVKIFNEKTFAGKIISQIQAEFSRHCNR